MRPSRHACWSRAALAAVVLGAVGSACAQERRAPSAPGARRVWRDLGASRVVQRLVQVPSGEHLEVDLRSRSSFLAKVHLWDEQAGVELSRGAQVVHINRERAPRVVRIVAIGRGRGHLKVNDAVEPVELGGAALGVPGGVGYRYALAAPPGGATHAGLFGFDATGRLVAVAMPDTGLATLASDAVTTLVVDAPAGKPLHAYVNDPRDDDGDGLGVQLERALGTCDSADQDGCAQASLLRYYRAVGTRDSDRDGLSDRDEVLGVRAGEGTLALDLPRWGADPRHKDAFVEVDYLGKLGHVGLSEAELAEVAARYGRGSAAALWNPDGAPGIRLHFDVGFEPAAPEHASLFGAWGGSDRVHSARARRMRAKHMRPERRGYFRYALATDSGTGQAGGGALSFNHHQNRVSVLAHELGHTFGLAHFGHPTWGRANCKPHYLSLMNYAYQNRAGQGFASLAVPELDPGAVLERGGLRALAGDDRARARMARRLREPPLSLDVWGQDVDWNRDGLISDEPVRAPLTWATHKSCGAPGGARVPLWRGRLAASSPALLSDGHHLQALWVDADGQLLWARAPRTGRADGQGSCPLGDRFGTPCAAWTRPRAVAGAGGLTAVSATVLGGRVLLAVVDTRGRIGLAPLEGTADDAPRLGAPVALPEAVTTHAPAMLAHAVDPARFGRARVLSILHRGPDGALWTLELGPDLGQPRLRPAPVDGGGPIALGLGPAVAALGTGETCGAFPDAERFVRFYCYAPERDAWLDLSAQAFYEGSGPRTEGPVGLAFHRYRAFDGRAIGQGGTRGALYLSFQVDETRWEPNAAWWLVSEWLDATHGAHARVRFRWRGRVVDQWTDLQPGAGLALYEDARLSALKVLVPRRQGPGRSTSLELLPLADGAFSGGLAAGDDFAVMERGVCLGLHGEGPAGEARCGDARTGAY